MIKVLDRMPIGKKTVGFVTLLLAMMLGISVYSFYRIRAVSRAEMDLAEWIVPIDDAFCAIEAHTLAEEVHLQKLLRFYQQPNPDQAAITRELSFLKSRQQRTSDEITGAKTHITQALASVKVAQDGVIVGQFQTLLSKFEEQYQQYQSISGKTLAASKQKNAAKIKALETQLDLEEDRLDSLAEDIRAQAAKSTEARSHNLTHDQQGIIWLSLESLLVAVAAFLLGVWVSAIIARRLVSSVRQILTGAEDIAQGNLNVQVPVSSGDEIGMLANSFNRMVEELRTKEMIKSKFSEYIDPRVVETLLKQGNENSINNGQRQVMTVFFSDIVGFSSISEILTPLGLVKLINEYLTLASQPILKHKGVIDKFIGDAVMSFWGPPFTSESEHAILACLASLEQFEQLKKLEAILPDLLGFRQGLPTVDIRIGICTGELVVGNIGSTLSRSYTVIGDTVNLAARLESVNKQYGTRILISQETYVRVKGHFETREIDTIVVAGKSQPVQVYELLGQSGKVAPQTLELRQRFERGLAHYRQSDWSSAEEAFISALELNPTDKASKVFLERIRTLREAAPADWDGIWRMTTK